MALWAGNGARAARRAICYLVPGAGIFAIGGMIAGIRGLVVVAAFVVTAAPVIGFTRNQIRLTEKGTRLATTVAEVRSLKEADSDAFARFFKVRNISSGDRRLSYSLGAASDDQYDFSLPFRDGNHFVADCLSFPALAGKAHSGTARFWSSLTYPERCWLAAAAHSENFPVGAALCRQDARASHIFIIMSGQVVVYVAEPGGQRCVAVRSAGDIVGERAAIEVRSRSATVVTVVEVRALVITTSDFATFLERHPRVLAVLERHVYDRLVENRPAELGGRPADVIVGQPQWSGLNCSIFLADIAAFGAQVRNDAHRQFLRDAMYSTLQRVFDSSGVPWHGCHHEDRGDGVLVVIPPSTPTSLLINPLPGGLSAALTEYNSHATEAARMQLRVALHVGPVMSDREGVNGESIIIAARLLEAPVLKRELASESANVGLIVSEFVYEAVVKHSPDRACTDGYRHVRFRVKESRLGAWICLLGGADR